MIAFLSDIHANRAALEAVFADLDSLGSVERIYCLGDVVGYGPDPLECLDLVAQRCKMVLMGNHEHALLYGAYGFHAGAKRAIEWTRRALAGIEPAAKRKAVFELIEHLPVRHEMADVLLVHGSPRDPVMEYVLESDLWEGSDPEKMEQIFAGFGRLCFVGHTHKPGVFTEDRCFLAASELEAGFDVRDGRYLINVGSVGQPRDRNPHASFAILHEPDAGESGGGIVEFIRTPYDVQATVEKVRGIEALDNFLGMRLVDGR
jgi:diadenosine tetraphosphatase ApaH/serine/threonine PP2A family protein phosphatase